VTVRTAADLPAEAERRRRTANDEALRRLTTAEPELVTVAPAGQVVPGFTETTVLTSGAPLAWPEYAGGQRRAIVGGVLAEGLAPNPDAAVAALDAGDVQVRSTQELGCIGSVAGIYTATMPVLVVRDPVHGTTAYCNLYEGASRHRLNYGTWNEDVRRGLEWLRTTMGPVLAEALELSGPLPLRPTLSRALRLGDELHSRNTAATLLLQRALTGPLFELARRDGWADPVREVLDFLATNDYTFLRLSMAAAKATADAAHGVPGSSVVTAMALSCRDFAVRVSGLGDAWFRGAHPDLEGRFFDDFTAADAEWVGGESCVTETVGLGGFAQACAPTLMDYQGGSFAAMCARNEAMYDICVGEHPEYRIPAFDFRGTPVGIDLARVVATGVTPVIDGGLAGRDGGQIGAGVLRTRPDAFDGAWRAYLALAGTEGP
jgi:hypothetical protein